MSLEAGEGRPEEMMEAWTGMTPVEFERSEHNHLSGFWVRSSGEKWIC